MRLVPRLTNLLIHHAIIAIWMLSLLIGGTAVVLTFLVSHSLSQALLAGGTTVGNTLGLFNQLFGNGRDGQGDDGPQRIGGGEGGE